MRNRFKIQELRFKNGIVIAILAVVAVGGYAFSARINAIDPVDELQQQIDELSHLKSLSEAATTPLEGQLADIQKKITNIGNQLKAAQAQTVKLEQDIDARQDKLAESYQYLSVRVRSFYMLSRHTSPLMTLLAADSAAGITRELMYRSAAAEQDKDAIVKTTQDLLQLEDDKKTLEQRKVQLAALSGQFAKNADFFSGEIKKAKDYQAQLSSKIAELSAKQKEILAQKSGTFQTTVGDVPLADDPASRPDYNPGFSPAYAVFSFGAPHFKGMSQYGALGRAKAGQSVEEILKAYYGGGIEIKKDYDTNIKIRVDGYGSYDLESYAKRIYEVPASWGDQGGMEALKAQAVAARSYALARTNNGAGSICATEACQVFKPGEKGGKWNEAVDATKGWVLMANGKPFSAWYASTSGGYQQSYSDNGYSTPGFWDTPNGRGGWTANAYEKQAGSPWFYKGWYKSRAGDSCGRSHPWLNPEEMADILNAWVVIVKNGQSDDRVVPQGSCWGSNAYSLGELRDRANSAGGGYQQVNGVDVTYADNGVTAQVRFETNRGSVTISGEEFKKAFNLRAPGNIAVKSGLFNIEKK
jgi:peptidoglycan hydrolase-like amidase